MVPLKIYAQNVDARMQIAGRTQEANCDLVTALSLPAGKLVVTSELYVDDDEVVHTLEFTDQVGERIVDFFERYLSEGPNPAADCHTFVWQVKGWHNEDATTEWHKRAQYGSPTPFKTPQSGEAYGVQGPDRKITHTVLGTSDPAMNLSVIGQGAPLTLASYEDMARVYGGHMVTLGTPSLSQS